MCGLTRGPTASFSMYLRGAPGWRMQVAHAGGACRVAHAGWRMRGGACGWRMRVAHGGAPTHGVTAQPPRNALAAGSYARCKHQPASSC